MIPTAKVTSRGQTVIPKKVRQRLGIHPGDLVRFVVRDKAVVIEKVELGASAKDPFATFVEWESEADRRAYDDL
jgi:antitoxin PrlF